MGDAEFRQADAHAELALEQDTPDFQAHHCAYQAPAHSLSCLDSDSSKAVSYSSLRFEAPHMHGMFAPNEFQALQAHLRINFDLDAYCKDSGSNRLCHQYCSPNRPFQRQNAAGLSIWANPPYVKISQALTHFQDLKALRPDTSAAFLLPKIFQAPWAKHLDGFRLIKEYPGYQTPFVLYDPGIKQYKQITTRIPYQVWFSAPASPEHASPLRLCAAQQPNHMCVHLTVNGAHTIGMLDSGSSAVFLSAPFAHKLGIPVLHTEVRVEVATSQFARAAATAGPIDIGMEGVATSSQAYVLPRLVGGMDIILGESWLIPNKVMLDYEAMCASIPRPDGARIQALPVHARDGLTLSPCALAGNQGIETFSKKQAAKLIAQGCKSFLVFVRAPLGQASSQADAVSSAVAHKFPGPQAEQHSAPDLIPEGQLRTLINEFSDVLVHELPPGLPPDRDVPHTIPTEPGKPPPCRPMYRLSPAEFREVQAQVHELLRRGFITPSTSPYGSPVLFVQKKDGSLRMVIDYRALNRQTIKNKYPIPRIDELLDKMHGCRVFSTLDLYSGYHQIKITPEDCPKTAFRTPLGHFEFKVLPFGLANAPATFQALMNRVLAPVKDFAEAYLDDIVVRSRNAAEHLSHLRRVFQLLREHRLYAKLPKCTFNRPEVHYLGHVVGRDGLKVDPEKVRAVAEWPRPTDAHHVRSFLGLTNYFRKFIKGYAAIAAPLHELTNKGK